jgi:hypothetical protein
MDHPLRHQFFQLPIFSAAVVRLGWKKRKKKNVSVADPPVGDDDKMNSCEQWAQPPPAHNQISYEKEKKQGATNASHGDYKRALRSGYRTEGNKG